MPQSWTVGQAILAVLVQCPVSVLSDSVPLNSRNCTGVKNPIRLARCVLEYSRIPDKLGRLPPVYASYSAGLLYYDGRNNLGQSRLMVHAISSRPTPPKLASMSK